MLARLQNLFIEPVTIGRDVRVSVAGRATAATSDVELVVVGLSPGCGTTTVATGVALALIERDYDGNLIRVGTDDERADPGAIQLGPLRLWDVPAALREPSEISQYGGMVARIAGGRGTGARQTATVWDLRASGAPQGAEVMKEVGTVVVVAHGDSDPALAELAAEMLAERQQRTILVANRTAAGSGWERRARVLVPASRSGVRQIGRGGLGHGGFAAALRELAELATLAGADG